MNRVRPWHLVGLLLVGGGCFARGGARPPQPDATTLRWRSLIGCYQMEGGQFALDSVPDLKLNADRPGVRRALFAPTPAIVGGYWFISERGAVWVVRHDGLWGRTYEFTEKGDSLVGREFVRTDVPDARIPPEPAAAVRTGSCQVQSPPETPPDK